MSAFDSFERDHHRAAGRCGNGVFGGVVANPALAGADSGRTSALPGREAGSTGLTVFDADDTDDEMAFEQSVSSIAGQKFAFAQLSASPGRICFSISGEHGIVHVSHGHGTFPGLDLLDHGHDRLVDRNRNGMFGGPIADVAIEVIDFGGASALQGLKRGRFDTTMF